MFLTADEANSVDTQVARIEARTGVQIVTAVVGKSDAYAELPWKAFAIGASIAALGLVVADMTRPEWVTASTALLHVVTILGVAGAGALLTVFVPSFARLFLTATRSDVEVRQYAQALFLERELFNTRNRTGVLLFVSLFERRIEILSDVGFRDRVTHADWRAVTAGMTSELRRRRPFEALQAGLYAVDTLLAAKGFTAATPGAAGVNELPDRPIEERGV